MYGLIGFPNAGKSTILSVVTKAHPKIADYPFTTLEPNLGVAKTEYGDSFVLADIPGIIEGASEGTGLGIRFLRHIERTRLLLHVIDVSGADGRDPVSDFNIINEELKKYSEKLAARKQIIVANKIDAVGAALQAARVACDATPTGTGTISKRKRIRNIQDISCHRRRCERTIH